MKDLAVLPGVLAFVPILTISPPLALEQAENSPLGLCTARPRQSAIASMR
jgi:hypothetical protein